MIRIEDITLEGEIRQVLSMKLMLKKDNILGKGWKDTCITSAENIATFDMGKWILWQPTPVSVISSQIVQKIG